jgi:hypothetical protein
VLAGWPPESGIAGRTNKLVALPCMQRRSALRNHERVTITPPTDDTMIVTLRVADLRAVVQAAVAEALAVKRQDDLLDMKQVAERYGIGRRAAQAAARRGEVELSQGPRRRLLVRASEVERWLTQRKYTPPIAKPVGELDAHGQALDAIERAIAAGRLRRLSPHEIEEARVRRERETAQRRQRRKKPRS